MSLVILTIKQVFFLPFRGFFGEMCVSTGLVGIGLTPFQRWACFAGRGASSVFAHPGWLSWRNSPGSTLCCLVELCPTPQQGSCPAPAKGTRPFGIPAAARLIMGFYVSLLPSPAGLTCTIICLILGNACSTAAWTCSAMAWPSQSVLLPSALISIST